MLKNTIPRINRALKFVRDRVRGEHPPEMPSTREFQDHATALVLYWLQRGNAGMEKKVETLNDAVALVGIEAVFEQTNDDAGRPAAAGWRTSSEVDGQRAIKFRGEIEECWPLGRVEIEIACVQRTLVREWRVTHNAD